MPPRLKRVCGRCGGDGKTSTGETPCPACGKVFQDTVIDVNHLKLDDSPETYVDRLLSKPGFDASKFRARYDHLLKTPEYQRMEYNLKALIKSVMCGDALPCSYFVNFTDEGLLDTLADSLLATTFRCGGKIFPYTRAHVLFQLQVHKEKYQEYPNYTDYTPRDLLTADILCIKIDPERFNVHYFIGSVNEVIDIRADHGKPTLIFLSGEGKKLFSQKNLSDYSSIRELKSKIKSPKHMSNTYANLLFLGCKV